MAGNFNCCWALRQLSADQLQGAPEAAGRATEVADRQQTIGGIFLPLKGGSPWLIAADQLQGAPEAAGRATEVANRQQQFNQRGCGFFSS